MSSLPSTAIETLRTLRHSQAVYDAMTLEELGAAVRRIRKSAALTQGQLAAVLDVSATYVSRIESGKRRASLSMLNDIASELGVDVDTVLGVEQLPERVSSATTVRLALAYLRSLPVDSTERRELEVEFWLTAMQLTRERATRST